MSAIFICFKTVRGYWEIQYRDGQLVGQYAKWKDALAQIRAIHGRTIPSHRHPDRKRNA